MKKINKRSVFKRIIRLFPEICDAHTVPIGLGYAGKDEKALFKDFNSFEIDQSASGADMLEYCLSVIHKPQVYTLEKTVPWLELAFNVVFDEEYLSYAQCAVDIYNAAEKNRDVDEVVGIFTHRRQTDHFLFPLVRLVLFFSFAERCDVKEFSSRIRAFCEDESVLNSIARMEETKARTFTPKETERLLSAIFKKP